jgi:sugar/nucleoside kinase (ribokinase family)
VVNDFGHCFLTSRLRALLSDSPTYLALNTQTNSANLGFNLITKYRSARYCCIDFAESKLAAQLPHGDPEECGRSLIGKLNADLFMTTNGRNGATLLGSNGEVIDAPAVSPAIVDRVGAGDAFFAITSPWADRNYAPELLGFIGNCVGALQVSVVGNRTPVGLVPLARFITSILK